MKKITILFVAFALLSACKKNTRIKEAKADTPKAVTKVYPENISTIFEAHGGIDTWNGMENLVFAMQKGEDLETTTVGLKSRQSLIETTNHQLGFDGSNVWLQNKDTVTYKGNARFYYNLMFYFYAMPFVLGDDGISYKDIDPLEVDGKQYPGIHISYDAGIGESDGDEYILYYDSETNKMAWLAYTVTFFEKKVTPTFSLIKYTEWQDLNGLQLPAVLQWYVYEDGKVGEMRNEMKFINTAISKEMNAAIFAKPETATLVE